MPWLEPSAAAEAGRATPTFGLVADARGLARRLTLGLAALPLGILPSGLRHQAFSWADRPRRRMVRLGLLLTVRLDAWRDRVERKWAAIDLVPDLAEDIGSRRWFRGVGTLLGLSAVALAFWPDFAALEAAPPMPAVESVRDELRSQMIMPLALGADSGRRMAVSALVRPVAQAPERAMVQLTATLGQRDSLGSMLQRAGVRSSEAAALTGAIAEQVNLGEIGSGTRFAVTLGRRPTADEARPLDRLEFRARFDLAVAVERGSSGFVVTRKPILVDGTPLRIRGMVGNSLYRSARAAGAPAGAIQQYLRTLDSHLSLEGDIAPTDHFDIVVAYRRSLGGEREAGELLFAGLERNGKPKAQLLRWGRDGQFFEASGMGRQSAGTISPVNGRLTSLFGMRRHPILGYARLHAGIDFGARHGTPIYAVGNATVSFAGRHGGHGNYVRLDHGGGLGTGYAHMSRIAVAPGMRVSAGQVIGYVGSSGLSTGPHLHYELYRNGRAVNPLSVRLAMESQMDKQELSAFRARLAQIKSIAPGEALKPLSTRQAMATTLEREIGRLAS